MVTWEIIVEGSLEAKLSTIWTDEKHSQEEEAARNSDVEKVRREKRRDGEDAGARKSRKVAKHCVFPCCFVAPEGRKVGSLKRRVRK